MSVAAAKTEHLFTYKHLVDLVVGRNNKKRRGVSNSVKCVCSCVHVCIYIYTYVSVCVCIYTYICVIHVCLFIIKRRGKREESSVRCEEVRGLEKGEAYGSNESESDHLEHWEHSSNLGLLVMFSLLHLWPSPRHRTLLHMLRLRPTVPPDDNVATAANILTSEKRGVIRKRELCCSLDGKHRPGRRRARPRPDRCHRLVQELARHKRPGCSRDGRLLALLRRHPFFFESP